MPTKKGKDSLGQSIKENKKYVYVPEEDFKLLVEVAKKTLEEKKGLEAKRKGEVIDFKYNGKHIGQLVQHEEGAVDLMFGNDASKALEGLFFK